MERERRFAGIGHMAKTQFSSGNTEVFLNRLYAFRRDAISDIGPAPVPPDPDADEMKVKAEQRRAKAAAAAAKAVAKANSKKEKEAAAQMVAAAAAEAAEAAEGDADPFAGLEPPRFEAGAARSYGVEHGGPAPKMPQVLR